MDYEVYTFIFFTKNNKQDFFIKMQFILHIMCPSLTFWVQLTILAILRIWYHLKALCLQITVLNIIRRYFYFSCIYHRFEMHALSIMNSVYVKYNGVTFLSIHFLSTLLYNCANI